MSDDYERRSYGDTPVGFGQKPGIVVVDFMNGRIVSRRMRVTGSGVFLGANTPAQRM